MINRLALTLILLLSGLIIAAQDNEDPETFPSDVVTETQAKMDSLT